MTSSALSSHFRLLTIGCCLIWLVTAGSCQTHTPAVQPPPEPVEPLVLNKLLVMPVKDMAAAHGVGVSIRCQLCGTIFRTGPVVAGAAETMTSLIETRINEEDTLEIVGSDRAQGAMAEVLSQQQANLSQRELLVRVGRQMGADAILVGHLYRWIERVGGKYSIESPASILFDVDLVRTTDGRLIWGGTFDETQQDLLTDILKMDKFLKRKGTWLSAEELALVGVQEVFESFPEP